MMVAVPDHSAVTLLFIVAWHVLPETCILMDGWWVYHQLPGPHDIVNHRLCFMDPNDPTLHTNMVEGCGFTLHTPYFHGARTVPNC